MATTLVENTLATGTLNPEADSQVLMQRRSPRMNLLFGFWMVFFHVGALAALFFFSWKAVLVTAILWVFSQNIGIAVTYHRLLTHRGFVVPRWLEYAMTFCSTLAFEGGPIYWVAVHRLHHQLTDKPGDPHSPRDGIFWSHMGWILYGTLRNKDMALLNRYAPDLAKDRFYVWLSRWHFLPGIALGAALFYFGGWSWFLWGFFVRIVVSLHVTWLVNSATHLWGSRRFETKDDSRNLWWVAILSGGEGWHNNHHAHPVSTSHGMAWYEIDVNYWLIRALGAVGLAKRIKVQTAKPGPARVIHG
ncbi:acyl-CoA desaturase [Silvibacterium sp.]|uniref:acyl-CoA desaturase n=1 Tax=Silvibacterium sp. TaxID=1964179 RepID=UPI0039E328B4